MQILQVTEWIKILDKILSKSGTPRGKGILWVESSGGNLCRFLEDAQCMDDFRFSDVT